MATLVIWGVALYALGNMIEKRDEPKEVTKEEFMKEMGWE